MHIFLRRETMGRTLNSLQAKVWAAFIAFGLATSMNASARASDAQIDGRAIVQSMSEAVLATLRVRAERTAREARFREMYRRYFDNPGMAAFAIGPAIRHATPQQSQQLMRTFEDYVVAVYSRLLAGYSGEKLLIMSSEPEGNGVIVTTLLVPSSYRAQSLELKWRLARVGGQLKVRDVVVDKISMALAQKRTITDWLRERGGTLEGLMGKLREKTTEVEKF